MHFILVKKLIRLLIVRKEDKVAYKKVEFTKLPRIVKRGKNNGVHTKKKLV